VNAALVVLAVALLVSPGRCVGARLRSLTAPAGPALAFSRTVSAAGAVLLGGAIGATVGGLLPALAAGLISLTAQQKWQERRRARADARAASALAAALEVLIAELQIGAHPAVACAVAAEEVDGPVALVLTEAAARARLGASAADGLHAKQPGLDAELERLAAAWRVAEERGVALADLVDAVRRDLTGRIRFRSRTQAGLAGARSTAAVLAGLPLLGIALGQAIGAAPVALLLRDTTGGLLLVAGTVLVCAGLWWTGRITARAVR
jgi:tight adherence protein B